MRGLQDKRAIVTGSARGIGRAVAERLLEEGCRVAFADVDVAEATDAAAKADPDGTRSTVIETDVQDRTSIQSMVDNVTSNWGGVDVLVSNAGIMDRMPFLEMTDEFWDRVTTLNLKGAFRCGQIVARQMVEQGGTGRIVNVASNSGIFGGRGRAAYGASKAGLINLTQTMAIELAEHDINVNAVAPGPTKTGPHLPAEPWPSVRDRMPLGRFGDPSEIASVAAFLASEESSFVTGHVYGADGGYTTSGIMEG